MRLRPYEVRLSRKFVFLTLTVALLLVAVGCYLIVSAVTFGKHMVPLLVIGAVFTIVGLLILWKQWRYFMHPPIMLRLSEQSISFGTGFSYVLETFPLRLVTAINILWKEPLRKDPEAEVDIVENGIEILFEEIDSLPERLNTPAGVIYEHYTLRLYKPYINDTPTKMRTTINRFLKNYQKYHMN